MTVLKVLIKSNYGNKLIYPACTQSKLFCELLETKTLSKSAVETIKKLGFTFEVQAESINL